MRSSQRFRDAWVPLARLTLISFGNPLFLKTRRVFRFHRNLLGFMPWSELCSSRCLWSSPFLRPIVFGAPRQQSFVL